MIIFMYAHISQEMFKNAIHDLIISYFLDLTDQIIAPTRLHKTDLESAAQL